MIDFITYLLTLRYLDGDMRKLIDCNLDISYSHIGNSAGSTVAVYNVNYSVLLNSAKLAPSTCKAYAHELYIPRSGIDLLDLQLNIGNPILKASCSYTHRRQIFLKIKHLKFPLAFTSQGLFNKLSN